jgi:hypothetical protein
LFVSFGIKALFFLIPAFGQSLYQTFLNRLLANPIVSEFSLKNLWSLTKNLTLGHLILKVILLPENQKKDRTRSQ